MDQKRPSPIRILQRVQNGRNLNTLTKNMFDILSNIGEEKENEVIYHEGDSSEEIVMESSCQNVDQVNKIRLSATGLHVHFDSEEMLIKAGKGKVQKTVGLKRHASLDNLVECLPSPNIVKKFLKLCKSIKEAKAKEQNKRITRTSSKARDSQSLSGNQ